jgi:hypothetical protein
MNESFTLQPSLTLTDEQSASIVVDIAGAGNAQVAKRQNLSGDQATWIVLANIAVTALPQLISFLKDRRESGKVKKFVISGVCEVENPTPSQIDDLTLILKQKYLQQ